MDDRAADVAYMAALVKLQAHARKWLVKRWLRRFYRDSKVMEPHWWRLIFATLLFFKFMLNAVCVITATDKTTQYDAAIPTQGNSDSTTPFQNHPHLYGNLYQLLVSSHVFSGIMLFVTGAIPVFARKGAKCHVIVGRMFLFFWLWHLVDGLINATTVLLSRGNALSSVVAKVVPGTALTLLPVAPLQ